MVVDSSRGEVFFPGQVKQIEIEYVLGPVKGSGNLTMPGICFCLSAISDLLLPTTHGDFQLLKLLC